MGNPKEQRISFEPTTELESDLVNELIVFHQSIFAEQANTSAIAIEREERELRKLFCHPETVVGISRDENGKIVGVIDMFPLLNEDAQELMPWVNVSYYEQFAEFNPYYVTTVAVENSERGGQSASSLMRELFDGYKDETGLISFDCNTGNTSAAVPIMVTRVTGWKLYPSKKTALTLAKLGRDEGLDANPVWYLCRDQEILDRVKEVSSQRA